MATMYDVAKAAGVSPSTVSRVLNNRSYITEETRKKVEAAIKKTGYTPNIVARSMITRYSGVIGVIVPDIRNPHHSESAFTIEQTMNSLGYNCILCNCTGSIELSQHYLNLLIQRKVDGIILVGSFFRNKKIEEYLDRYIKRIPVVIANGYLDLDNVYGILSDDEGGIEHAIDHLISTGKRHLLYIQSSRSPSGEAMFKSYLRHMKQLHLAPDYEIIPQGDLQNGSALADRIFNNRPLVNGIIFDAPLVAIGCCTRLQSYNIKIPHEIGLITTDNVVFNEICDPPLSCIDNHIEQVAMEASRTINDLIHGLLRSRRITISTEIVRRQST